MKLRKSIAFLLSMILILVSAKSVYCLIRPTQLYAEKFRTAEDIAILIGGGNSCTKVTS